MRLAANLTLLYGDLPVADRFAAAARDGFTYVEILQPYDYSAHWYAQQLHEHGLELILINTPVTSPDYSMGVAAQPGVASVFQAAIDQAAHVCHVTGCQQIHVLAGLRNTTFSRDAQSQVLRENLRWALARHPALEFNLEALNQDDVPAYFYDRPAQVAAELTKLSGTRIGMQFDFYHVTKQGLNLIEQLDANIDDVRHVQVAGAPLRHEPELYADDVWAGFKRLQTLGYQRYVGLEYRPENGVANGLSWLQPLLDQGLARF